MSITIQQIRVRHLNALQAQHAMKKHLNTVQEFFEQAKSIGYEHTEAYFKEAHYADKEAVAEAFVDLGLPHTFFVERVWEDVNSYERALNSVIDLLIEDGWHLGRWSKRDVIYLEKTVTVFAFEDEKAAVSVRLRFE